MIGGMGFQAFFLLGPALRFRKLSEYSVFPMMRVASSIKLFSSVALLAASATACNTRNSVN